VRPNGPLRTQDPELVNRRRLQRALEAFERCLRLEPGDSGKNIRAWTCKAFTYHLLGLHDEEVRYWSLALEGRSIGQICTLSSWQGRPSERNPSERK
jgi:hypothetical protein